jgi:beta-lactamase superfamily II metal-dependent hydrolase
VKTTVTVRMYNVGFGDCFLVTVSKGDKVWRMLVDCGVHSQGGVRIKAKPWRIRDVVNLVIADLEAVAPAGTPPHLDVIVATHKHTDHISGFNIDSWERVTVGEVWLPFVENPDDPDAAALGQRLTAAAGELKGLIEARQASARGLDASKLELAHDFAINSFSNAEAMARLRGDGLEFHNHPVPIRYLPDTDAAKNVIEIGIEGVRAHILGPSRDPEQLKKMEPPSGVAWLALADDRRAQIEAGSEIFANAYRVPDDAIASNVSKTLLDARDSSDLTTVDDDIDELLTASAVLEDAVNNTSVFFVLDVNGTRLLFVGDSQQGAWDHVLGTDESRALVTGVDFYKIGHHGSHNATPREFVEKVMRDKSYAMLPWGLVKKWQKTIPKAELMTGLTKRKTHIVRADQPDDTIAKVDIDPDLRWSQVTFTS